MENNMKKYETIELDVKDRIYTIWLNRPERHNAFNNIMLKEIIDCFKSLNESEARCIVLRGKGKSFCAGADLNWMKETNSNDYEQSYSDSLLLSECFYTIYTCKKPTIAVAHGNILGGANGLVAACDISYCTDEATFSLSEIKIGIVPSCISPYIIKRIGEFFSRELMLTGRRFKGTEAEYIRLVNKSLPYNILEEQVNVTIEHLKTSAPEAMTECKKLIYDVANSLTLEDAYNYTAKLITEMRQREEAQEGMRAFLEKRKPNWLD